MTQKRMLNLGCGATFHEDWVNVDFINHKGKVLSYDLRLGIPFADDSFDVVYHSHILEHMPKAWGEFFIAECYRVLQPGGLLRVVVPDLENIARAYLDCLDAAKRGEDGADQKHKWMLVELIDQFTRTQSGGEMFEFWKQNPLPQQDFILQRLGNEAKIGIAGAQGKPPIRPTTALPLVDTNFFTQGELHKWMYDTVSLGALLTQNGFVKIEQKAHNESFLPEITHYGLDTTIEGKSRKPDSFFMEAIKPLPPSETAHEKNIRVALFSASDRGGAAIAASRLHEALRSINIKSNMYVAQKDFFQKNVYVLPSYSKNNFGPSVNMSAAGKDATCCMRIEYSKCYENERTVMKGYPNRLQGAEFFSVPWQCVPLNTVPFLDDFDILHFHWMTGLLEPSFDAQYLKGKKIVWTLHDMNAFTGGCHYSNGCRKFETMCSMCPELGSNEEKDLAFETWRSRMGTYRELDITVVTPSAWLAEEAKKSALLSRFPIHHIPNVHPLHIFRPLQRESIRQFLGLKPDNLALLFASQLLSNTRKGSIYLVELLHMLAQSSLKDRITVFLLGNDTKPEFSNTGIKIECLGHVNDQRYMASLYNAADAVVVPSLEDNQPNVICEALGCGTPVVAFANGGISEMLRHEETGFLAESKSVDGLLQGVLWAFAQLNNPLTRRLCRAHALEQFSPDKGAQNYKELYKSITQI